MSGVKGNKVLNSKTFTYKDTLEENGTQGKKNTSRTKLTFLNSYGKFQLESVEIKIS